MLKLYVKTNCAFSAPVLKKLHDDNIPFQELNVSDPAVREELLTQTESTRTPFLVDEERSVSMHESENIIDYIHEHYSNKETAANPDAYRAEGGVCEA